MALDYKLKRVESAAKSYRALALQFWDEGPKQNLVTTYRIRGQEEEVVHRRPLPPPHCLNTNRAVDEHYFPHRVQEYRDNMLRDTYDFVVDGLKKEEPIIFDGKVLHAKDVESFDVRLEDLK